MGERTHDTTSRAFFESVYESNADPWSFATDAYELARYREIVGLIGDRYYQRAFEPGCSVGVLTEMLAPSCGHLLATDLSEAAARRARRRCAHLPQVEVHQGRLPDLMPAAAVDLVVLSEIGYYFSPAGLAAVLARLRDRMADGGVLVAAHWTGVSDDHVISGDEVHDLLDGTPGLRREEAERRRGYLIGRYERRGPSPSVAL